MSRVDFLSTFKYIKEYVSQPVVLVTTLFIALMLSLSFFDGALGGALEFDREKIQGGEYWRLLTGNFVHFGLYHTVMNLLSVGLIGVCLYWAYPSWVWVGLFIAVPLAGGCGLFFLSHDIDVYRGYSGAVYGLALTGLILNWSVNPWIASAVIAGLCGKLFYERLPSYDVNFLVDKIGVPVAVDAHLWGGIAGVALSIPLWFILRQYRYALLRHT